MRHVTLFKEVAPTAVAELPHLKALLVQQQQLLPRNPLQACPAHMLRGVYSSATCHHLLVGGRRSSSSSSSQASMVTQVLALRICLEQTPPAMLVTVAALRMAQHAPSSARNPTLVGSRRPSKQLAALDRGIIPLSAAWHPTALCGDTPMLAAAAQQLPPHQSHLQQQMGRRILQQSRQQSAPVCMNLARAQVVLRLRRRMLLLQRPVLLGLVLLLMAR